MARRFLREFDKGAHSVYMLYYHLVIVTKYRQKILNYNVHRRITEIFEYVSDVYDINLIEYGGEDDHFHVLFTAPPDCQISKFICSLKSSSSRILKDEGLVFTTNKKGVVWSPSYCLLTTGGAPIDVVKKYIQNQGGKK